MWHEESDEDEYSHRVDVHRELKGREAQAGEDGQEPEEAC
jgi:hypothetical protein